MDISRVVAARNLAQIVNILSGLSGGEDAPEPFSRKEMALRLAEGTVTVLDVRLADEYATGHIPSAINVTLAGLDRS